MTSLIGEKAEREFIARRNEQAVREMEAFKRVEDTATGGPCVAGDQFWVTLHHMLRELKRRRIAMAEMPSSVGSAP